MADAAKILSQVSGLSETTVKEVFEEVKANNRRINGCSRHRFEPPADGVRMGEKFTCLACGGVMRLGEIGQYLRGYTAAGGNPDDIWPGWK